MSNKNINEAAIDNANSIPGKVAIDKYEDGELAKSIKKFFDKHDIANLKRIESTAQGSELFDLDITIDLPKETDGEHAQKVRETGSALVHQLKQDFYNHLNKEGFKINSMSVRGVRTNGDVIETTISLILANVPKVHRENIERIQDLIENVLLETSYIEEAKKKETEPSLKPPKEWFKKMEKDVKKDNPKYSQAKVDATIGKIWYKDLDNAKRKEIRARYGKTYGKADKK